MNILFHGVHGLISLAMFEDLANAFKFYGHRVFFEFGVLGEPAAASDIIVKMGFQLYQNEPVDAMFLADPRCYPDRKCPTIDLGHGLGCKAGYYYDTIEYTTDYLFTSSVWIANKMAKRPKTQIIATGMPKHDRAVSIRQQAGMVLIAPTHNPCYNALLMLESQLPLLIQRGHRVVIKPHVYLSSGVAKHPGVREHIQAILSEAARVGVEIRYDYNIIDLLAQAEYVISDVSSAYMEALGLGKKVVICESDYMRMERDQKLAQGAYEYLFQQDCVVIKRSDDLIGAMSQAKPTTQDRQEMLVSNLGHAIETIIRKTEEICGKR